MTDKQIQQAVSRFLGWKLPDDFMPDGGVSYEKTTNSPNWKTTGTNLLTATQAEEMIRYILETPVNEKLREIAEAPILPKMDTTQRDALITAMKSAIKKMRKVNK